MSPTGTSSPSDPWVPQVGDTVYVWAETFADPHCVLAVERTENGASARVTVRTEASGNKGTGYPLPLHVVFRSERACLRVALRLALIELADAQRAQRSAFAAVEHIERQLTAAIKERFLSLPKKDESAP